MLEPPVAAQLRSYLRRFGHRSRPVRVTSKQLEELQRLGLVVTDPAGCVRFEGQELQAIAPHRPW